MQGLRAPVTVTRDQWGIPHIVAANTDDLFFAQGFVQAQDRLFQMDLWKRSAQGRLSEVLGANFIQRDSMTRRIQFRGDLEREWASYGPDTRRIAVAFTNGINAWVRIARRDPPEEFALAGWQPDLWRPEDLLNRTDAFLASTGALAELLRARLISAIGPQRANVLLPAAGDGHVVLDEAVDLSAITFVVSDAVRRIGTPPFFLTLAGHVSDAPRPGRATGELRQAPPDALRNPPISANSAALAELPAARTAGITAWVEGAKRTSSDGPSVGIEEAGSLVAPSRVYLVHLTAPGWNVIGAARPWLPGVVAGHNDRVAWAMAPLAIDTQDIVVERVNPADPHQVRRADRWVDMSVDFERVDVKGRDRPVEYERQYTSNGVVIAQDKQRGLVYTLRWTGTEPGGAGELAALDLGRADSWSGFRQRLDRWTAPPSEFVYADIDGVVGRQRAGLFPQRRPGGGATPSAGWSNDRIWTSLVRLSAAAANLDTTGELTPADASSQTVLSVLNSSEHIRVLPRDVEVARDRLRAAGSPELLRQFFYTVRRLALERGGVPRELRDELLYAVDPSLGYVNPQAAMFGAEESGRTDVLISALRMLGEASTGKPQNATVTFEHPLAVFDNSRLRFNVGAVLRQNPPPSFHAKFNTREWDRSIAISAPGQSGSPASPHYDDLAVQVGRSCGYFSGVYPIEGDRRGSRRPEAHSARWTRRRDNPAMRQPRRRDRLLQRWAVSGSCVRVPVSRKVSRMSGVTGARLKASAPTASRIAFNTAP